MPWYKSGTVSVALNSNAVIGTGTAFLSNGRVGDAFRGPDGGWYEITNIASDTALSISPNYQSAPNAAGVYAIAPMQGYVKDSADALRALVNQFGGVLAVLGTTPTTAGVRIALNLSDTGGLPEGTNKYYTDARVRAAVLTGLITTDSSAVMATDAIIAAFGKLQAQASAAATAIGNKAGKGANSDITSLTGLTTALSVAQGGTGVTSVAALLTALQTAGAYGKTNAVGTVGQASGVPTGAIVERGSNGNGDFTKFADGTMICTRTINLSSLIITATAGGVAYVGLNGLAFPATFVGIPVVNMSMIGSGGLSWVAMGSALPTATATQAYFVVVPVAGTYAFTGQIMAIGRWF
jgi:hypothetical protein